MLYSWVDTYYVSRLGSAAIAAIGISEQLIFLVFTIGAGFAIGSGVVVARRVGEGKQKEADNTGTQSIILMFFFSVILAAGLYFSVDFILSLMNITGPERLLAIEYLRAVFVGIPGYFIIFQINAIVRSSGNSIYPMIILIIATVLNAVISPLLVFGIGPFPELGIAGAGIATAIAQTSGAAIALITLKKDYTPFTLITKGLKFEPLVIWRIIKIGTPATLQFLTVSLNRMALFAIANMFGTTVVAAYTLGLKVDLFVFMSVFATGATVEITTGQNLGANNIGRVFAYYKSGIRQLSILMAGLGILVYFFGADFTKIFTANEEILNKTEVYFRFMAFSYLPFSIGILSTRLINGAGDTMRSLVIVSVLLLVFQLPAVYMLSSWTSLGDNGIWLGILLSQFLFALIGFIEARREKWRKVTV